MKTGRNEIIRLLLSLGIVLAVGYVLSFVFFKVDLTEEKRHTLTDPTKEMLENLEDKVMVRCYLHGEFPAGFKRLEQSIKEQLDEFNDYSSGQIDYEFIDPYESGDKKTIAKNEEALYEKGLRFTRISIDENGTQSYKMIWPGAIIEYRGQEVPVQFFKSDMPEQTDAMINSSVNNLEYELASNLRRALKSEKQAVAILQGEGELKDIEMGDFLTTLNESYPIEFVKINEKVNAFSDKLEGMARRINRYAALLIAKPDSAFSERNLTLIDQYIMNGGKVLWLVDPVVTDLDSLAKQQQTMAVSNDLGIFPMLFTYGARLNRTLILDYQCAPIALDAGPKGNQRELKMFPWYYAPLMFAGESPHPITANLDPIKLDFASSIDTVNSTTAIKKFPLLVSSKLTKEMKAPIRVNPGIVDFGQDYFKSGNQSNRITALLMEGVFPSAFVENLTDVIKNDPDFAYQPKSVPTKMIVVADGDVVRNKVVPTKDGTWMPQALGYDMYAKQVIYDNKEFLMNCMNYLMDDQALISVRSRSIKLRKLNTELVNDSKNRIKFDNTVYPLLLIVALGIAQYFIRKKKWAQIPVAS
jgi:ABC-2 type transport system permease protein